MKYTKQTKRVLEELFKDLGNKRIDLGDYRFLKRKYLGERIHFLDKDKRYLCIKACSITKGKYTKDRKKVTCENCIRKLSAIPSRTKVRGARILKAAGEMWK